MKEQKEKDHKTYRKNFKITDVNPALSVISLNISGLNTPVKRKRSTIQTSGKNHNPAMLSTRDTLQIQNTNRLKVKEWKRYAIQTKIKRKLEWLYQYCTKQTLRQKITRGKEGHFVMIIGSICQENVTIMTKPQNK